MTAGTAIVRPQRTDQSQDPARRLDRTVLYAPLVGVLKLFLQLAGGAGTGGHLEP